MMNYQEKEVLIYLEVNKKILIFDDVLSKLDNKTKNKIVDNLNKNYPNNINIFITHDLLRIPKGCRVLFIDNKTIIDSTNTKLEKDNKNYKKLIDICENVVGSLYEQHKIYVKLW